METGQYYFMKFNDITDKETRELMGELCCSPNGTITPCGHFIRRSEKLNTWIVWFDDKYGPIFIQQFLGHGLVQVVLAPLNNVPHPYFLHKYKIQVDDHLRPNICLQFKQELMAKVWHPSRLSFDC